MTAHSPEDRALLTIAEAADRGIIGVYVGPEFVRRLASLGLVTAARVGQRPELTASGRARVATLRAGRDATRPKLAGGNDCLIQS